MSSTQPAGDIPYTGERTTVPTPSLTSLPEDAPPEALAALIAQREEESKKLAWAQWVDSEYSKCRNARTPFERQWYLNLAFTAGKQYVTPMDSPTSGFRLTVPKAPAHRVRLVVNKVRTAVIGECSKLTSSKPIPTVKPASSEAEDFAAAAVGERLLEAEFATSEFEQTYRRFVWWGVVCGTSFLKQYYDPQKLDYDCMKLPDPPIIPSTGEPVPDEMIDMVPGLREHLETPQPARGKICVERVTPFHLYVPDLLSEGIEAQPYIIHVMTKSPLWVENRYGFKPTPDARASATVLDAARIITKGTEEHMDAVLVKEVWIKPGGHKDFPQGGLLTVINGKVVQHSPKWPYPFVDYPFYKYDGVPTGGFYSDSKVTDLIPIQKEYNKTRSQAIEIKNMMLKPKLLYPQGSINPKKINTEPGQSIPYIQGYEKPEILDPPEVPVSYVQEMESLNVEFDDISGQHEISRGQTPTSAISSGTAIAYLQEQDDAKLVYQVASIENACEMLGKHYLYFVSHYWGNDRVIKVTGKDRAFETMLWKKGMLRGNHDVKVQTGSALPFSKAARTALVQEMMMNGFLDPTTGMEMMNFGGLDKAVDEVLIDKHQAMRENLKMANYPEEGLQLLLNPAPGPDGNPPFTVEVPEQQQQQQQGPPGQEQNGGSAPDQAQGGEEPATKTLQFNGDGTPFQPQPPVPVNSWDDHEMHVHWHNHYRKSQEFEQLSEEHKQAFEIHVQLHQFALQAQMVNAQGFNLMPPDSGQNEMDESETTEESYNEDAEGNKSSSTKTESSSSSKPPPSE